MGQYSRCDSVDAIPLVLRERSLAAVEDGLPSGLAFLGAPVTGEHGVLGDELLGFEDSHVSGGTELHGGRGFDRGDAILPCAEVSGRLAELIQTRLRESLGGMVEFRRHIVDVLRHWEPPCRGPR